LATRTKQALSALTHTLACPMFGSQPYSSPPGRGTKRPAWLDGDDNGSPGKGGKGKGSAASRGIPMPDAKPMPLIIRVRKAQKFLELVQPTMQTDEVMYAIFQEAMGNMARAGLVHLQVELLPLAPRDAHSLCFPNTHSL